MTTELLAHPAFTDSYALLDELCCAGREYGLTWATEANLAQALIELTDFGRYEPSRLVAPIVTDAAEGFATLKALLDSMLLEMTDLASTLRLTRVRELVDRAQAP